MRMAELHKDTALVRYRLDQAFKMLRKRGYLAEGEFACCQSCGFAAAEEMGHQKVVFYHDQDANYLKERGECWLCWQGDGQEIKLACEAAGLKVHWDGTVQRRIKVCAPPLN